VTETSDNIGVEWQEDNRTNEMLMSKIQDTIASLSTRVRRDRCCRTQLIMIINVNYNKMMWSRHTQ
jgi:hypothetical protein